MLTQKYNYYFYKHKTILNFMKKLMLLSLVYLLFSNAYSQKVLLYQNVKKDSVIPQWGLNRKNFICFYAGWGDFIGPKHDELEILYPNSMEITAGFVYKRRISNFYSFGVKYNFDFSNFRLKPNSILSHYDTTILKQYPGLKSYEHKKEKITFTNLSFTLFNRINFDKRRGDHLGHYLDIGAYGSYMFSVKHVTKDKINGNMIKTSTTKMDYPNEMIWGIYAGLGFNKVIIYYKYQMSDYFKKSSDMTELPHSLIGLQFMFR
jgi:hypothetical protein